LWRKCGRHARALEEKGLIGQAHRIAVPQVDFPSAPRRIVIRVSIIDVLRLAERIHVVEHGIELR